MNIKSIPNEACFPRVAGPGTNTDSVDAVGNHLTIIRCDLAKQAQMSPEMSDEEVLAANDRVEGFAWLNHVGEDLYR